MSHVVPIALKAVRHATHANLFSAVALAAVLTPLLVLYGLKLGIITGMFAELRADPGILRIGVAGHRPLTEDDIAALRARPETGFVVGAPRSIAASAEMRRDRSALDIISADWLPTAAGDPLLPDGFPPIADGQIVLSERLAEKLLAKPGDRVVGSVYRNSQTESLDMEMTVALILPRGALEGDRALVSVARLNAMAAFADEINAAPAGAAPRAPVYDSLRLYARSIEAVADLERAVAAYGFRTSSEAANIAWVQQLDQVMGGVFTIISVSGVAGYGISLWAMITGSVRQSRPQLSLLRLLGMSRAKLLLFPLVQSLSITSAGLAIAFVLAYAASTVMNRLFLVEVFQGRICLLRPADLLLAAGASYLFALLVAARQVIEIQHISPTEALAENLA
ncbi:ABC transporter permease [Ancylobacter sp. IITR112]|uniref:ABC transporter permease n=1 Tax=Ancylobacter sp. IITR112 TaxID=3138073 RepID=UPI003529D450